jgi:SH3-like domain-containing protein
MLTVINCKVAVTLRKAPLKTSKTLAEISLGETVEYLGAAKKGFCKVKYGGKTGYLLAFYLTDPAK